LLDGEESQMFIHTSDPFEKDHAGIFNFVDIDNALELGYKIKLIDMGEA
jgi:hypothetical protein